MLFHLAFAALLLAAPAAAQHSTLWSTCTGKPDVDWEQQIKSCTAIIESKQETEANLAVAYNNRGVARLEMVASSMVLPDESAMADFGMAIKLNPKYADAYYNRGRVWQAAGVYHNAIDLYSYAIKLDPKHAGAYRQRGLAWFMAGDVKRARTDMDAAIRLDPNEAGAYLERSYVRHAARDVSGAIADLTKAIRINPDLAVAYRDRARILIEKNDFKRATADFGEAIRIEPDKASHHANRGYVHFFRADFAAAAADLQRAAELEPDHYNDVAPQVLFRYLARTRAGQEARAELEAVSDVSPYASIQKLYLGQATPEEAMEDASSYDRCRVQFYVGQWHVIRAEREAARRLLKQAAADACKDFYPHRRAALVELRRLRR